MDQEACYEEYQQVRQEAKMVTKEIQCNSHGTQRGEKRYKRPRLSKLHVYLKKIETGDWNETKEMALYLDEAKQILHKLKMKHSIAYRLKCKVMCASELLPDPYLTKHRATPTPHPHTGNIQ